MAYSFCTVAIRAYWVFSRTSAYLVNYKNIELAKTDLPFRNSIVIKSEKLTLLEAV
jgi:hypothetical protein